MLNVKKESLQSDDESIKKSNELSIAELNHGLTLNQMQLLAYAIFSTQQNGKTEFQKHDFEKKFGIQQYNTKDAYKDSKQISSLQASIKDLKNDYFKFTNVFMDMVYDKGHFTFNWHPDMTPHILELKERYVVTDLEIASKFKSGFSWRLYEYLKGYYGYLRKILSRKEIYELFNVQDKKSYQSNVSFFKRSVLDVAIEEVNLYTELEVWYKEQKKGRTITGFEIYWSKGKVRKKATKTQLSYIQSIINSVEENMFSYIDLNNQKYRQKAFGLTEHIKSYQQTIIDPIEITSDKANEIIREVDADLMMLDDMLQKDKDSNYQTSSKFPFYNWLEDD